MVGITAIFVFLGIMLGLISGAWWGFDQSWLVGLAASIGGAIIGGLIGVTYGVYQEEVPRWIDKFSEKHRVLGGIFFWLFVLSCFVFFAALALSFHIFMRHMKHHP